jgi:hypothetical protein
VLFGFLLCEHSIHPQAHSPVIPQLPDLFVDPQPAVQSRGWAFKEKKKETESVCFLLDKAFARGASDSITRLPCMSDA